MFGVTGTEATERQLPYLLTGEGFTEVFTWKRGVTGVQTPLLIGVEAPDGAPKIKSGVGELGERGGVDELNTTFPADDRICANSALLTSATKVSIF